MSASDDPLDLADRWRGGDQRAAADLFHRYAERLIELARRHLTGRLAARIDAEDVVQSACRSFFLGLRDGKFALECSGDLWKLLATITLRKLRNQVRFHTAARRDGREESGGAGELADGREPTPEDAAVLGEVLERLFAAVPGPHRRILELRLQGYRVEETAELVGCSRPTVIRLMRRVREQLEAWYG